MKVLALDRLNPDNAYWWTHYIKLSCLIRKKDYENLVNGL